ncbi:MAG: hypothetical protein RLZZ15_1304 [Verrucomicrobiota bacterium]|jgi:agarase
MAHASDAPFSPEANDGVALRLEAARGAEGFFRAAPDAHGRWWLVEPAGRAMFLRGVHGVRHAAPDADPEEADAAVLGNARAAAARAPLDPAARLRAWGFNAVGLGGDGAGRDDGLAFLACADFVRAAPPIAMHGARLPDVFAPDWPRRAEAHALALCAPLADERQLLGWVTDDVAGWAQPAPSRPARPTLLQICLSLEPTFAAYHAAWEFTLALHGGQLAAVARAWGEPLANKEIVREHTRAERALASRGYLRDHARWTGEFARRYFATTAHALRAAAPHHLVLGCRTAGPVGEAVRAAALAPAVDVALVDWRELPAPARGDPVIADGVCWADEEFFRAPAGARGPALTAVERMLRRGRGALERMARHPAVAGYVWRQWLDEPGEQPPFARGLVHRNGAGAREHTELLAAFHGRAEAARRAVRPAAPATITAVPPVFSAASALPATT